MWSSGGVIKIYGAGYLVVVTVCAVFEGELTLDPVLEMMILFCSMMGFELLYIHVSPKNVHKGGAVGTAQFIQLGDTSFEPHYVCEA